jgi:hypothetical protein
MTKIIILEDLFWGEIIITIITNFKDVYLGIL